jgi:hypothetical protein
MDCACDGESRCIEHRGEYVVIDLDTDESQGGFETLGEARGCVLYNRLRAYSIWHNDVRVECCDPYEGDDDRIKQALGLPNASEAE